MNRLLSVFIALLIFLLPALSHAAETAWEKTDEASVRLIAGDYKQNLKAGFHFKLAKNWHTYWRSPGDGGRAMTADFSKSENIKSVEIKWPAPERFIQYGLETFAYSDEVIIPVIITPEDPTKEVKINTIAQYAICDEVCIFLSSNFSLDVQPETIDSKNEELIEKYLYYVPAETGTNGLSIDDVFLYPKSLEIYVSSLEHPFKSPDLFVEELSANFRFPKAKISFYDNSSRAIFRINYEVLLKDKQLAGNNVILTLKDGNYAVEKQVIIPRILATQNEPELPSATLQRTLPEYSLIFVIFAAFIGGLILNIMPCVLPVLSIKLLSVVKHGGKHKSHIRFNFLMSSAGIIFSFLLLAALVSSLKFFGIIVGWGFHFQQPLFLTFLVIILNFFAAAQFGLFDIRLPGFINDAINDKLKDDSHTAAGHFLTGAFATLLATPCSAPFLGTAIGFALARGAGEIFITFFFMGLGLALPYLIFAFLPNLISKLPKPGKWMVNVKYFMGLLLIITSVWLIWVLSHQEGLLSAIALGGFSIVLFIAMWETHKDHRKPNVTLLLLIIIASFYLPVFLGNGNKAQEISNEEIWQPFNQSEIKKLVNDGKIVFVDVTADWCLTCKFNKMTVLNDSEVIEKLKNQDVISMKADYTSKNEEISAYLKSFGRYAIPFNVVYGPSHPEGIVLSELLTKTSVINALKQASGD